eukprot:2966975-Rhodomonas_salina.2
MVIAAGVGARKGMSEDVSINKFFDDPMLLELARQTWRAVPGPGPPGLLLATPPSLLGTLRVPKAPPLGTCGYLSVCCWDSLLGASRSGLASMCLAGHGRWLSARSRALSAQEVTGAAMIG